MADDRLDSVVVEMLAFDLLLKGGLVLLLTRLLFLHGAARGRTQAGAGADGEGVRLQLLEIGAAAGRTARLVGPHERLEFGGAGPAAEVEERHGHVILRSRSPAGPV